MEPNDRADGEAAFVEARGDMELADGRADENLCLRRLTAQDGRVNGIRKHSNPATAAQAVGRLTGG